MRYLLFFAALLIGTTTTYSQYSFSGHISDSVQGKNVYLSLVEDYRKLSRTYLEQVVSKTTTDAHGFFEFTGDHLIRENRIYKIHIDECSENMKKTHFFQSCKNEKSILFIANVLDTIYFPTTFQDEIFCDITSTNMASGSLLEVNALKEEMAYELSGFRSETNRKLNFKKWFGKLQDYGENSKEPLVALYVFQFLSDRGNDTFEYYIKEVQKNPFYSNLLEDLQQNYPQTFFTELYASEILSDTRFRTKSTANTPYWMYVLGMLLFLSLAVNLYFLLKQKKKDPDQTLNKLTRQEQKIGALIAQDKTNKEIATELFISLSTVKTHVNNLYKKLSVNDREALKNLF